MAQRKTTTRKKAPARKAKSKQNSAVMWQAFSRSTGGRFLKVALLMTALVLLTLLISRNDFDLFFLLLGIELLFVFLLILLYLAWQQRTIDPKRPK